MSEDVFVLVFAARYHKASARFVFRGFTKKCLNDNLISMIHERYMVLVHLDENARSTIHAALQRAWVQKTLRVPITRQNEQLLLQDKRRAEQDTRRAACASRNAEEASENVERSKRMVMETRARILHEQVHEQDPRQSARFAQNLLKDEELLAVAEQQAASDAAEATSLAETEAKGDARDAVRATEIARIGPMMKIPDWVKAVVFFT